MPRKIFISYRRQDSAANALGIGQYLEHQFGRKNVFIDVDMHAGANFRTVLEQRLAECKVMIVLIGPDWLNSRDEQGHRRLDNADDWVRLEIAHALRRNITVIPVCVGGGSLPPRAALPDDIRGLLDHQATSITLTGFRHEMAGLVRDIRSIPSPRRWQRFGTIAAGVLLWVAVLAWPLTSAVRNMLERFRPPASSQVSATLKKDDIWKSSPGEWVMYAFDTQPVTFYFKPSSVRTVGDSAMYTARYPLKPNLAAQSNKEFPQAAYGDDTSVLDCKKSIFALAERTIYSKSGESMSHFTRGDPQSLDLSTGELIKPGSIVSMAKNIMCDEKPRTPLLSEKTADMKLSYLAPTPKGDGSFFYSPITTTSDSNYREAVLVGKFDHDHDFADLFPGQTVLGLPRSYRTMAQTLRLNCSNRKVQAPITQYFDDKNALVSVYAPDPVPPMDANEGSPIELLITTACSAPLPSVSGTYEGINKANYKNGGQGDQKIEVTVEQMGADLKVNFQSGGGGQGKGVGKLSGARVDSISLQSTAAECPGSYEASFEFAGDTVTWSFKGDDCGGPMEGHGTAKRVRP
jgi:hypothetical protein